MRLFSFVLFGYGGQDLCPFFLSIGTGQFLLHQFESELKKHPLSPGKLIKHCIKHFTKHFVETRDPKRSSRDAAERVRGDKLKNACKSKLSYNNEGEFESSIVLLSPMLEHSSTQKKRLFKWREHNT